MATSTEWDYCTIDVQLVDDGRSDAFHAGPGNKLVWFRFIARSSGPNGTYVESRSEKTPLANLTGTTLAPDAGNVGHQNVLDNLLAALEQDGWVLLSDDGGEWWHKWLQRPAMSRHFSPSTTMRWVIPSITFIAILLLGWLLIHERQKNFVGNLDEYISIALEDSSNSVDVAQPITNILPINLETHALDPIYEELPIELRAPNAEEINALAWIDCKAKANWRHSTADCRVILIDYETREVIDERVIKAAENGPPHTHDTFALRDEGGILGYLMEAADLADP